MIETGVWCEHIQDHINVFISRVLNSMSLHKGVACLNIITNSIEQSSIQSVNQAIDQSIIQSIMINSDSITQSINQSVN